MSNDYGQLAAIVAIIMAAFELIKYVINKWTNNGTQGIRKQINDMTDNHIHELQDTLNRVDKRTEQIVNILIEIKGYLRK